MSPLAPERLAEEFVEWAREGEWFRDSEPVIIALSGGVDSLVLLHLFHGALRASGSSPLLHPAHFDHAMRPGSGEEADRLERTVKAWGLPLHRETAAPPPRSETEARSARHAFLKRVKERTGARWIALGHHAGDQRETVLFRILRGTGIRGLAGMRQQTPEGLLRPLLLREREDLRAYANAHGLEPIEDPSNALTTLSRNRIRHELLPLAERVHPGAPESILRLARRAHEHDRALRALLAPHLERLLSTNPAPREAFAEPQTGAEFAIARDELLSHPPPVRAELVRALAERAGARLTESGTAAVMQFISGGSSGGRIELSGTVELGRDFDVLRFGPPREDGPDGGTEGDGVEPSGASLLLSNAGGEDEVMAGNVRYRVRWSRGDTPGASSGSEADFSTSFRTDQLEGPLRMRFRRPGDRVWTRRGSRALKRLLRELRVARAERAVLPLLVDAEERVLWIPGHWRAPLASPDEPSESWTIGVTHVGHSA